MDERDLLKKLEIPEICWIRRNMPMNQITPRISSKQAKTLQETIKAYGIRILASLKEENTNIPKLVDSDNRYEEIIIFSIELKEWKSHQAIFKILVGVFPYPIVVHFHHDDKQQLMVAKYRLYNDNLVVDQVYSSLDENDFDQYLDSVKFSKLDKYNLKACYESYSQKVTKLNLETEYQLETSKRVDEAKLEEIKTLEKEIEKIRNKARKETQMNHRVRLNMKLQKLIKKRDKLLEEMT